MARMLTPLMQRPITAVRRIGELIVPNRPKAPPEPLTAPSFTTHAGAAAWLALYLAVTGHDTPDDWPTLTLREKRTVAQALFEHWQADHT